MWIHRECILHVYNPDTTHGTPETADCGGRLPEGSTSGAAVRPGSLRQVVFGYHVNLWQGITVMIRNVEEMAASCPLLLL